jgi:hypothetical protein
VPARYAGPAGGSQLERYARALNAVEINSSFYRPHQRKTYDRWAESTPEAFRFSVKMPRTITHNDRLANCDAMLDRLIAEVTGLGDKLGVLLVQLPPKLVTNFFELATGADRRREGGGQFLECCHVNGSDKSLPGSSHVVRRRLRPTTLTHANFRRRQGLGVHFPSRESVESGVDTPADT